MPLLFSAEIAEAFRKSARGQGPEFSQKFESNFLTPYLQGRQYLSIRSAANYYFHIAIGGIEDPSLDHLAVRRCLCEEGDERVWLKHVDTIIIPLLARYGSLPVWSSIAPEGFR